MDEYYAYIFENSVPGLPEAAGAEGLTPLEYMRKYAAFEVARDVYGVNEAPVPEADLQGAAEDGELLKKDGRTVGVSVDGRAFFQGYGTTRRKASHLEVLPPEKK